MNFTSFKILNPILAIFDDGQCRAIFGFACEKGKRDISLTYRVLEMRERMSTGRRRVQGWVQGFERGSDVTRMFRGANLAQTCSLTSFYLRVRVLQMRYHGKIQRARAAWKLQRGEKRGRHLKLFITPVMNHQWLSSNWFRVYENLANAKTRNQYFDVPRFTS